MSDYKTIYISNETELRLAKIAEETGRDIAELASSAVDEAAMEYFRSRPSDDPAK